MGNYSFWNSLNHLKATLAGVFPPLFLTGAFFNRFLKDKIRVTFFLLFVTISLHVMMKIVSKNFGYYLLIFCTNVIMLLMTIFCVCLLFSV
jgi:hypothetical protein